jgi:Delta14-sterol reductase
MSKHDVANVLNPQTQHYEFLGPPGALFVSAVVPFLTFAFSFACSEKAGGCPSSYATLPSQLIETVQDVEWWKAQWDPEGFAVYFGWYAFCILSWVILPGDWVEGLPTRTGQKIKYKINGMPCPQYTTPFHHAKFLYVAFSTLLLASGIVGGMIWTRGPASFTYIYNHWIGILTGAFVNSVAQATLCYLFSFRQGTLLALGGNSGNHLYDVCLEFTT